MPTAASSTATRASICRSSDGTRMVVHPMRTKAVQASGTIWRAYRGARGSVTGSSSHRDAPYAGEGALGRGVSDRSGEAQERRTGREPALGAAEEELELDGPVVLDRHDDGRGGHRDPEVG